MERFGRHIEQVFYLTQVLRHDAQPPPQFAAGLCSQSLNNFLLQHEVHIGNDCGVVQQLENQWRRDVVGQVAHHAQWLPAVLFGQMSVIECECIMTVHCEIRLQSMGRQQTRQQVAVQFDDIELAAAVDKPRCQCALSRAYLHEVLFRARIDRLQNAIDNGGVVQKILPETFAGPVLCRCVAHSFNTVTEVRFLVRLMASLHLTLVYSPLYDNKKTDNPPMPLSQYWRLVDVMARMSLRADATRFVLGYIWWVLEPILYVIVLYVVFGIMLETRQPDFLVFLAVGKLIFLWFSKSVTAAGNSIVSGKGLVGKVNVPKSIFPLAVVQEGLYKQVTVFLLLFIFVLVNGYTVNWLWLYLVPIILVNYLMIVACAFVAAVAVCVVRDVMPMISLGMIFLLFTSGLFWDVRSLSDPAMSALVLNLNPMAFILDAYRQVMLYETAPNMVHLLTLGAGFGALTCAMILIMRSKSQYLALKALTA